MLCSMNSVISIRIEKKVKEEAQEVARSIGVSLSTLVNSYLKQIIATRRIELYAPEPMTPKLESLIAEVEAELDSGQFSQKFDNAEDFLAALKK